MKFQLLIIAVLAAIVFSKDINVKNSSELQKALDDAAPGDVINIKDGTYKGSFEAKKSGKDGKPITLKGGRGAKITSGNDGYGFHLTGSYWLLEGFTVEKSGKGIVLDGASNNVLNNMNVNHVNDEAVHFRYNSCDNVIQNSEIII
jgi:nitrous oxidase accessory protein NosD